MKKIIDNNENVTSNSKQIEILKRNFPNCFDREGKFLPCKLNAIINDETEINNESYELNWLGKKYARLLANQEVTTMLTEDVEHNRKPENCNSQNLYIEGDNLEVLKHMVNTYSNKIKVIYIDPPYNTGTDFIYKDNRKFTVDELSKLANIDEDDARRILDFTESNSNSHSAWLTFMYPRLYIARELLTEDGVIFISIDDNENSQLKLLCDEIFGESNYIKDLIINTSEGGGQAKYVFNGHEYCYVYARDLSKFSNLKRPKEIRGKKIVINGELHWLQEDSYRKEHGKYGNLHYEEILEYKSQAYKDIIDEKIEKKEIILIKKGNGMNIMAKPRKVSEDFSKFHSIIKPEYIQKHLTKIGNIENSDLFDGKKLFDNPKPLDLLNKLILSSTFDGSDDYILDFFSGSATTAHAVMHLNAKDNGKRKFIMVQLPEEITIKKNVEAYNFCKKELNMPVTIPTIAKERIRRAGTLIKEANTDKNYIKEMDFGFKVFKTKPIIETNYYKEMDEFDYKQTEMIVTNNLTNENLADLLLTWKLQDGIEFSDSLKELILDDYIVHYFDDKAYFMYKEFTNRNIVQLLEEIDDIKSDFSVRDLIVFALNFTSKEQRELVEALKGYKNKKKIELNIELRY